MKQGNLKDISANPENTKMCDNTAMDNNIPPYRNTFSGDSEEAQRAAAITKKEYSFLRLLDFIDNTCELCPDSIDVAITIQVHRLYKQIRTCTIIQGDEHFPILEIYVCNKHANASSFYKLGKVDWPGFANYLVLGTHEVPKYARWQIREIIIKDELEYVREGRYENDAFLQKRHKEMREEIAKMKKIEEIKMLRVGEPCDDMPDLISSSSDEDKSD